MLHGAGLEYLPTFTSTMAQMLVNIPAPWNTWVLLYPSASETTQADMLDGEVNTQARVDVFVSVMLNQGPPR
jgi:hypothetical protein